ncbi:hypothetical protein NA57DRAFT_53736 [Rhizodiscina lignyota]|uniref:Uncharacterized protein n=1 Tax=Rhizodiscina lignyota TaxID=1504668 RepID=A0A9P4IIL9_9PEZI|nr:hypothetical protein NA57DRAFT_53736 [Rhizodiscina lignyota]
MLFTFDLSATPFLRNPFQFLSRNPVFRPLRSTMGPPQSVAGGRPRTGVVKKNTPGGRYPNTTITKQPGHTRKLHPEPRAAPRLPTPGPFPIFKLPKDVRYKIYEYAGLIENTIVVTHRRHIPTNHHLNIIRISHVDRQTRSEVLHFVFGTRMLSVSIYDLEWFMDLFSDTLRHISRIVLRDFLCDYTETRVCFWAAQWREESLKKLVKVGKDYRTLKGVKIQVTKKDYALTADMVPMQLDQFRNLEQFELLEPHWWISTPKTGAPIEKRREKALAQKQEAIRKIVYQK